MVPSKKRLPATSSGWGIAGRQLAQTGISPARSPASPARQRASQRRTVSRPGQSRIFSQFAPLLESIQITPGPIHFTGNHGAFTWRMEATGKSGRTAAADGIDVMIFSEQSKIKPCMPTGMPDAFVAALTAV